MKYAVCSSAVGCIRNSASHKSELLSQILFGELVEILEEKGLRWAKIHSIEDDIVGWTARNELTIITDKQLEQYQQDFAFVFDLFQPAMDGSYFVPLTFGARLPLFDGMSCAIDKKSFTYSGQALSSSQLKQDRAMVQKIALKLLNVPYLWGGRSVLGMDGPAFTQLVYRMCNIKLPRQVDLQINKGEGVSFVELAQVGDIAFFENFKGKIVHCGVVLPDNKVIHAHGKVRIDTLDHYGIQNKAEGRYSHRLRIIKRLLPPLVETVDREKETKEVVA